MFVASRGSAQIVRGWCNIRSCGSGIGCAVSSAGRFAIALFPERHVIVVRLALSALAAVAVTACERLTADAQPQALPVWSKSGICSETYRCMRGRPGRRVAITCPSQQNTWCLAGAACNPNDTTPCVVLTRRVGEDYDRACRSEGTRSVTFAYDVLVCAPSGTWHPAEQSAASN